MSSRMRSNSESVRPSSRCRESLEMLIPKPVFRVGRRDRLALGARVPDSTTLPPAPAPECLGHAGPEPPPEARLDPAQLQRPAPEAASPAPELLLDLARLSALVAPLLCPKGLGLQVA